MASGGELNLSSSTIEWMTHELSRPQRHRGLTFSASSAGSCIRQQIFKYIGAPGKKRYSSETNAIFIAGHFAHLKWQALLLDAGILSETEVPLELPEYGLTGTVDGILSSGYGWELKSANQRVYTMVMQKARPKPEHLLQVHCYMKMAQVDKWSLVYENRGTAEWKEFVVNWEDSVWDLIEKDLIKMNHSLSTKELPAMLPDCEDRTGLVFNKCPYNEICPTAQWPQRQILINVDSKK